MYIYIYIYIIYYVSTQKFDEQVRILEHAYEYAVRKVIREFENKVNNRDSILDRFCIRMFNSDGKFYQKLFKTSNILREKSLIFQYHRDYPEGLPSFYRDWDYLQDLAESSDSDINAPSANPFYEDVINPGITRQNRSRKQQYIINTLIDKHGFEYDKVQSVVRKHPYASYEKVLEILTNIQRPNNQNDDENKDDQQPIITTPIITTPIHQSQGSEESDMDYEDTIVYDTGDVAKKYTLSSTISSSQQQSHVLKVFFVCNQYKTLCFYLVNKETTAFYIEFSQSLFGYYCVRSR